jgi:hypothetical protein
MSDTTIIKVDSAHSPHGKDGQKYLASGKSVSMRLWENEQPNEPKAPARREYETVGFVISGRAELHLEGQNGSARSRKFVGRARRRRHSYKILESFTAVEATHPPAQVHGRDE